MTLEFPKNFDNLYEERGGEFYLKDYIGGTWDYYSDEYMEIVNPFDGSTVGFVPRLASSGVEMAIDSAWKNREGIRSVPGIERIELFKTAAQIVRSNEEFLVRSLILEAGKPVHNAKAEVRAAINRMDLAAVEARKIFGEYVPGDWSEDTMQKIAIVLREPVGVVLAISPFNYPLFITSAKVVSALLAGNSVVVKLPSADPITFLLFTAMLEEAGLPPGSLNVITTSGKTLGTHIDDPRIGAISFTGSTAVGKEIAKKAGMKQHLHLELGGKGAAIVLPSADIDLAVKRVVHGSLNFSGQRCDAISRVIVVQAIAEPFVSKVMDEVRTVKYGNPWEEETLVGPLIDANAVAHVHKLVEDAVEKGAKLLFGGTYEGNVYLPTVLDHVPKDAGIMQEETFGPVVTIHRVKDINEAIEAANDTKYGLDSCVFTNNFYDAWRVAKSLKDGEITINDAPAHGVGFFPFGGTGDSGTGREGIGYSIEEMTRLKTVVFNLAPAKMGKKRKIFPM
ncbi:MAG: aldehyde dehydrogenase family protein [Methanophagales archaeon]|nr:aldehyde dehydrogenase family protein [Methanophagales archaeon]